MFQCPLKSDYELATSWKWLLTVPFNEIQSCDVVPSYYVKKR